MIDTFLLAVLQSVTEFLPVSSSAHLLLVSSFLKAENAHLMSVAAHGGTFLAAVYFFSKDYWGERASFSVVPRVLIIFILFASFPLLVVGFFLHFTGIIYHLEAPLIIGMGCIVFGFFLYKADKAPQEERVGAHQLTFRTALFVGLWHLFALIPGSSRSGVCITALRFKGFSRLQAVKISAFLGILPLGAVTLLSFYHLYNLQGEKLLILPVMGFSAVLSFLSLRVFVRYVQHFTMKAFVLYRMVLGSGLILWTLWNNGIGI